jgi:uncharacterized membrane protein YphA (DoxX/SURF4 family)
MALNVLQLPQVPLRLAAGGALLYHASPFLFTRAGHANFAYMLTQVGLPAPGVTAWMVALLEVVGGLALIAGFATVFFSIIVSFEIATRVLVIWLRGRGFPMPLEGMPPLPGFELNLQFLGEMICLIIAGPGLYSWDRAHPPGPNPAIGSVITQ